MWPGWTPGAGRAGCSGSTAPGAEDDVHAFRDWHDFEWLIGHAGSALLRGPFARIRRLKPAQIADLLEEASKEEETEILGRVHADPELEADVFEELDEDLATRLLGARTDAEIAAVLARMRATTPPTRSRNCRSRAAATPSLPAGQRAEVLTLIGYNATSAGGLMGHALRHGASIAPAGKRWNRSARPPRCSRGTRPGARHRRRRRAAVARRMARNRARPPCRTPRADRRQ